MQCELNCLHIGSPHLSPSCSCGSSWFSDLNVTFRDLKVVMKQRRFIRLLDCDEMIVDRFLFVICSLWKYVR